jgi:D-amino peptidase
MRKFFISADLEGCAAVAAPQGLAPERWNWEWSAARKWMTLEVVAIATAALESGYDEIVVADSHHNAHNIDPDLLPDNVWLVRSWPRPLIHMQGVEIDGVEACAFVGYHAESTNRDSIMAHTYHGGAFRAVRLNGEICSEGYLNAAVAGELGRPVILISGDQHTVEDSRRYAPDAVRFVTKYAIGWRSERSLPPPQVSRKLAQMATEAMRTPRPAPFRLGGPYHLELEMMTQVTAEMLSYLPCFERLDAYRVRAQCDSVRQAVQLVAFAMLYSPTGVAL